MACSRKALSSGYSYLSRRFHPSFIHIFQDDGELSRSPQPSPLSPSPLVRRASSYSKPIKSFISPARDWRRIGFALPFGIDQSSRSFSSSAEGSNEIGYVNDVADVLTDAGVDTGVVAAASSVPAPFPGEVAAAAADSFFPVAVGFNCLDHCIDSWGYCPSIDKPIEGYHETKYNEARVGEAQRRNR